MSGATLAATYGLGNLAGSLLVTAFPPTGEPERLVTRATALVATALAPGAAVSAYPAAVAAPAAGTAAAGALLATDDPRTLLLVGGAPMAATAGVAAVSRRRSGAGRSTSDRLERSERLSSDRR